MTTTMLSDSVSELRAFQQQCRRRWGLEVVLAAGAQERLVQTGGSLACALWGIADLVEYSGYVSGVLEIDVREEEDGPIPAAALSMSWI